MARIFIRGQEGQFQNYVNALTACGAEAVLSMDLSEADSCDGLVLPGGADINPKLYNQENTASEGIDDDRDRDEILLIHRFMAAGKPILGTCRGHQILNVALGGSMIQHIPVAPAHLRREDGTDNVNTVTALHPFIGELYGESFAVNSSHHQAVDRLGKGLIPTCISSDGIVEGFIHENGKIIGVQFHPERMAFGLRRADTVDGEPVFRAFLALTKTDESRKNPNA